MRLCATIRVRRSLVNRGRVTLASMLRAHVSLLMRFIPHGEPGTSLL